MTYEYVPFSNSSLYFYQNSYIVTFGYITTFGSFVVTCVSLSNLLILLLIVPFTTVIP